MLFYCFLYINDRRVYEQLLIINQMQQNESVQHFEQASYRSTEQVRLNVDNSNQNATFIFWGIFAIFLIAVFVTSNFTPEAFVIKTNESELTQTYHKGCTNPVEFDNGLLTCKEFSQQNTKIGLIMRDLSPLNQFAQINLIFLPKGQISGALHFKQMINVQLLSLKRKDIIVNEMKAIGLEKGQSIRKMENYVFDPKQHPLHDVIVNNGLIKKGHELNLGYYRSFHTKDALLVVTFISLNQTFFLHHQIFAQAVLMNPNYTIFMLCMRGTFLLIMCISFCLYYFKLRRQIMRYSCIEQRLVFDLSVGILLFNDPYYFISILWPNIISVFFSTFFVSSFLVLLLLIWLYLLQKIEVEAQGINFTPSQLQQCTFWILAAFYFCMIFAFNAQMGYYSWKEQPIIPAHQAFGVMFALSSVMFLFIFAYILWLYLKILQKWEKLVWRNRLFVCFNAFFVVLLLIFTSLGWFSLYDESSQKFQIFYASLNFYVLYMQYMYSTPFMSTQSSASLNQQFQQVHQSINSVQNEMTSGQVTIDLQADFKERQN